MQNTGKETAPKETFFSFMHNEKTDISMVTSPPAQSNYKKYNIQIDSFFNEILKDPITDFEKITALGKVWIRNLKHYNVPKDMMRSFKEMYGKCLTVFKEKGKCGTWELYKQYSGRRNRDDKGTSEDFKKLIKKLPETYLINKIWQGVFNLSPVTPETVRLSVLSNAYNDVRVNSEFLMSFLETYDEIAVTLSDVTRRKGLGGLASFYEQIEGHPYVHDVGYETYTARPVRTRHDNTVMTRQGTGMDFDTVGGRCCG